jgi:hypothetical protein
MSVDAVGMAQAFYESQNPGSRWHRLSWFEKVHYAVLAEREACAKYVAESFKSELVAGEDVAAAIRARSTP